MIEQFLNREFMVAVARGAYSVLSGEIAGRSGRRRRGPVSPLDAVPTDELRELAGALSALSAEFDWPGSGDEEQDAVVPPLGVPPRDDHVFLPHSRAMSILQSAVEQAVEEHQPDAIEEPRGAVGRRRGGAPAVTGRRLAGVDLLPRADPGRRVWRQMEMATGRWAWLSDPRWALSLACMFWRDAVTGCSPFIADPATIRIANNARVIIVGDWGSGLDRARDVASRIRAELDAGPDREHVVIHLGDVYYSGTRREYEQRFLRDWPVPAGSPAISLNLAGNHDLYSGGHAYYHALGDERFARQNGCSYFAVENDHWQFLGLDSAYEDGGLHGDQAGWARARIDAAPTAVRTCLLSHHQLFSAHGPGAGLLGERVEPVLATGRVDAWFWGHEHRCIEYGPTTHSGHRVGFASCLGHGGIPEYLVMPEGATRPAPWRYEYLTPYDDGLEPWGTFGFAVVDLDGPRMRVRYVDERGHHHHEVADAGADAR